MDDQPAGGDNVHDQCHKVPNAGGNNVHGNKKQYDDKKATNVDNVYAKEVHEQKGGQLVKIKGYQIGPQFIATQMQKNKVRDLLEQGQDYYPPKQMHLALTKYYGRYYKSETPELGGYGLFTRRDIKAGDFIGIYAGKKTRTGGEYVMEIGDSLTGSRTTRTI
jgi:hypothetical protein